MTLIDDYLKEQEKYEKKYGPYTTVLMQVGHFFEAYAVHNEDENSNGDNLYRLSDIMNIQMTRKNKNIIKNSRSNPLMIGVNIFSIDKFIQILLNNNYTIVLIEQTSQPPYVERKVTNIYSPGTNIKYNIKSKTNNLVCLYLESIKQGNYGKNLIVSGISSIDLSTGYNVIYETYSKIDDENFALDEIFRFIQTYDPNEIVVIKKNINIENNTLINYLDLQNRIVHFKEYDNLNKEDKNSFNLSYQTKFLEEIFPNTGMLSVIEYLDLENKNFGLISYIFLLNFAYEHNSNIIQKINKPINYDKNNYLCLTNNTINQLNVLSHNTNNINVKYDSLFSVINNNSTPIGKRLLRERLLNPIIDTNILKERYNNIESFLEKKLDVPIYKIVEYNLGKILDIERLHRKLSLKLLNPCDFGGLDLSYENILEILNIENETINKLKPKQDIIDKFKSFINKYKEDFDIVNIVKYNLDKITSSFFNRNICKEIDNVQDTINNIHSIYDKLIKKFSNLIEVDKNSLLKLEHNDRDGYYLSLTNKRANILKSKLKMKSFPEYNILNNNITTHDIEFKNVTKSNTKITSEALKKLSSICVKNEEYIKVLCKEKFLEKLDYYYENYHDCLDVITKFVGEIDVIKSCAKTACMYGYSKPIITENSRSFVDCKAIRHPIIENIQTKTPYITNNLVLGKENKNGILLFGTNASGKSSLMKALGLNIIMAQAGCYVAAEKFDYYPYKYLFSRICNNDNIFKGESSFAVEMSELRAILKRSTKHSLVLGDELCSGTESVSALSIFSASVIKLCQNNTNFIFATHLHELCKLEQIKSLNNLNIYHLKVIFDEVSKTLVYDRKLEPGNGPAIYGLEVCRAMDMDTEFIKLSENIRKTILDNHQKILNTNKSHYNSEIYLHNCEICNEKAQDVHHIKFQCTADENKIIDRHIKKDINSNLVPLCKKCHNDVHNNSITINGFVLTSNGVILDYVKHTKEEIVTMKNNNKKINLENINLIKEFKKSNPKITQKNALIYLDKNHNIKISASTYSKIINNKY